MRDFLEALTDSVVILNAAHEVIYMNESCRRITGYSLEDVAGKALTDWGVLREHTITACTKQQQLIEGRYTACKVAEIPESQYLIIQWYEGAEVGLSQLGRLVDKVERGICIRNMQDRHIFVNQICADSLEMTKEEATKFLDENIEKEIGKRFLCYQDDYVMATKKIVIYELPVELRGKTVRYRVKKIPILNQADEVAFIGILIEEVSIGKIMKDKVLDILDILEYGYKEEYGEMERYQHIFQDIVVMLEQHFRAHKINIWRYMPLRGSLVPCFDLNPCEIYCAQGRMKRHNEVLIEAREIESYRNGVYQKIAYPVVEKYKDMDYGQDIDPADAYILNYPIFHKEEFKGIISIQRISSAAIEAIENEKIQEICSHMGFILKYLELVDQLHQESKRNLLVRSELEMYLEAAVDFVIKMDPHGNFKYVSKTCLELLGWSEAEMLSLSWRSILHPDDLERTEAFSDSIIKRYFNIPFEETEREREIRKWENRYRCADGTYKWIRWGSKYQTDKDGLIILAARDITKEKEMEAERDMIKKMGELDELRKEFFANLSHELRTPLTLILSSLHMLKQEIETLDLIKENNSLVSKYVNITQQNSYRLWRLVSNLIDTTKIDAGYYRSYPRNENIISVVEDMVMSVADYCNNHHVEIVFDTEVEEEIIACDSDQIERIILNLLSNAVKYTPAGGKIFVDIVVKDTTVAIYVKDTGVGIPKDKLNFIFERFIQVKDIMTRPNEGSGLGLSIVKALVELHEGTISVDSVEGEGTTFAISLPRKQIEESQESQMKFIRQSHHMERCQIEFADIY